MPSAAATGSRKRSVEPLRRSRPQPFRGLRRLHGVACLRAADRRAEGRQAARRGLDVLRALRAGQRRRLVGQRGADEQAVRLRFDGMAAILPPSLWGKNRPFHPHFPGICAACSKNPRTAPSRACSPRRRAARPASARRRAAFCPSASEAPAPRWAGRCRSAGRAPRRPRRSRRRRGQTAAP